MNNLPDDVTPADIDRHYGGTDTMTVVGSVSVGVETEVPRDATTEEQKEALRRAVWDGFEEILEAHVSEVE